MQNIFPIFALKLCQFDRRTLVNENRNELWIFFENIHFLTWIDLIPELLNWQFKNSFGQTQGIETAENI